MNIEVVEQGIRNIESVQLYQIQQDSIEGQQAQQKEQSQQKKKIKKDFYLENILRKIFKILNLNKQILNKLTQFKTHHCEHSNDCVSHCFDKTIHGFGVGYALQVGLDLVYVLLSLLRGKKPVLSKVLKIFFNKSTFQFALFPMIYNLIQQTSTCVQRHILNKNSSFSSFISGALAGFFSINFIKPSSRAVWGVFLLSRGIECFYNHLVLTGTIKKRKTDWILIFAIMWIFCGYNFSHEPENMPISMQKFGNQVTNRDVADCDYSKAQIIRLNRQFIEKYGDDVELINYRKAISKPVKPIELPFFKKNQN